MLLLILWCASALAFAAQVAGTVVNLSGPLLAKKASGVVKVLALRSEVEEGDTLVSERNTYARIKFIDDSEITIKPGTTFKVESFAFDAGAPAKDSATFSLLKGGLRSITGLLGRRNKEKFLLRTPVATIGIRGTTFNVEYVEETEAALAARNAHLFASTAGIGGAPAGVVPLQLAQLNPPKPTAPNPGGLKPGLHLFVIDGSIIVSNAGGSQLFSSGQFGFVPRFGQPPIIVPNNPNLQFSPPPAFNMSNNPNAGNNNQPKPDTVDCEVR
ncbi:FecR family protein [Massilia glaciei]|uniref:FecR family protein n=1 Tax=Massilia glaciei TaxID=1524097 RepID=UPI001E5D2179|nr:FecR family protein [Massilia glaciei]